MKLGLETSCMVTGLCGGGTHIGSGSGLGVSLGARLCHPLLTLVSRAMPSTQLLARHLLSSLPKYTPKQQEGPGWQGAGGSAQQHWEIQLLLCQEQP